MHNLKTFIDDANLGKILTIDSRNRFNLCINYAAGTQQLTLRWRYSGTPAKLNKIAKPRIQKPRRFLLSNVTHHIHT